MRILVLGGTVYLGKATAIAARDAGHEVTCLARGVSGSPPDGVAFVRADRSDPASFDSLGEYDAVVDVSRKPSEMRTALAALAGRVGHVSYVSSCSVYADDATPGQTVDSAPLLAAAPPDVDENDQTTYGARKVACEQAVLATELPAFICRPGLVVGPGDVFDRFGYWPLRLARGGEVLAPGDPDRLVQVVDVRDLAAWLVHAAEQRLVATLDAMCPPMPFGDFLAQVAAGLGLDPQLTWVDQDFLLDAGVDFWMGPRTLPLWLPMPDYAGFMARDVAASLAAGLTIRPLAETARDTLAWEQSVLGSHDLSAGITDEDEADLLRRWAQARVG